MAELANAAWKSFTVYASEATTHHQRLPIFIGLARDFVAG